MLRRITRGAAGRRASERVLEAVRSRLEVAAAVSRERLVEAHVIQALELIELAQARVPPSRGVSIYSRLHRLSPEVAEIVRTRALAALGQDPALEAVTAEETVDAEVEEDNRPWIVTILGERFRPRVHLELRRWLELHTGRAEVVLLEAHVQNALRFVDILAAEMSYPEAIEVYLDTLGVLPPVADMVTFFTLERLSRDHLPSGVSQWASRSMHEGPLAPLLLSKRNGGDDARYGAASRLSADRRASDAAAHASESGNGSSAAGANGAPRTALGGEAASDGVAAHDDARKPARAPSMPRRNGRGRKRRAPEPAPRSAGEPSGAEAAGA